MTARTDLWSEGELTELRRLHDSGHSAAAIAKRIGKTRNAVLGRLHRENRTMHPAAVRKSRSEAMSKVWAKKRGGKPSTRQKASQAGGIVMAVRAAAERRDQPPNLDAGPIPPALPLAAAVSITDLGHRQCRWIGELPELLTLDTPVYCGAQTAEGSSWCPEHRSRVFAVRGVAPCQKPKPQSPLNIISRAR